MDKPATIVLQLDKSNDAFWLGIFSLDDRQTTHEIANIVIVTLLAKSYSLADHQFIQIKMDLKSRKGIHIWIPRNLVKMILEGNTNISAAFSFAGSKTK